METPADSQLSWTYFSSIIRFASRICSPSKTRSIPIHWYLRLLKRCHFIMCWHLWESSHTLNFHKRSSYENRSEYLFSEKCIWDYFRCFVWYWLRPRFTILTRSWSVREFLNSNECQLKNLDISGALYTLRIQYSYTQTQCDDGARDVRVL